MKLDRPSWRSGAVAGGRALRDALARAEDAFHGLRALLRDDETPLTIEQFLVSLVRAVRDDRRAEDRTARDVFETARSRRRRLGLASFSVGPLAGVATRLADLYCETATVCDLVELHRLGVDDAHVAAHMLVLWEIADDVEQAQAMVDGTGEQTVAGILAARAANRAAAHLPEQRTKLAAVKALWDARSLVGDARRAAATGSVGGVVFTGHRTKRFIKQAERQLGVV